MCAVRGCEEGLCRHICLEAAVVPLPPGKGASAQDYATGRGASAQDASAQDSTLGRGASAQDSALGRGLLGVEPGRVVQRVVHGLCRILFPMQAQTRG